MRIPVSTYRLQFNRNFTLKDAEAITRYLFRLGISDYYASPLLAARAGSPHGYDVTDHTRLNPEIGTNERLAEFTAVLKGYDMGLVMDLVPNHMCIADTKNVWWRDILENGPGSQFSRFFDIDWQPPKQDMSNKVLLPVLGDQYGKVLENQEIQLHYRRGVFIAQYYDTELPIAPRTWILILKPVLEIISANLKESHPHRLELESIITALDHLPPRTETDPEKVKERQREKEIVKRRISSLVASNSRMRRAIKRVIRDFNGVKGDPASFNRLEELLGAQPYRLSHWRVAADEINFRRFFDINELAAIRVEERKVFSAVHNFIFRMVKRGIVTGLRVDHIDGLYDPELYLKELQRGAVRALRGGQSTDGRNRSLNKPSFYVMVEKILGRNEELRENWATQGTTGYDFLNLLNGVFVDRSNEGAFRKIWQRITGGQERFDDVAYEGKKLVLRAAMSSELHVLARRLDRISEQHRYSRDFTLNSLEDALREVIACFPVYRSYIRARQGKVADDDRHYILSAVRSARRRNPAISSSIFEFIASVLLLEDPQGINDEQRAERRDFVMRFQQLTPPITAKGIEDTAFYRYYPLVSLCEVGGDPSLFGISIQTFHEHNRKRLARWPHTLLATSTHDTKRSEDARVRINVLSENPVNWYRTVRRWQKFNQDLKTSFEGSLAPDAGEEYLLYQTLVGVWPLISEESDQSFVERIEEYMIKAVREAKTHSSWLNQNEEYERCLRNFIRGILAAESDFVNDFTKNQSSVARAGIFNSLSQTLLKITAPGIPDFYQGTEIWDFSLVDPDNRRPVDYAHRQSLLDSLESNEGAELAEELISNPEDGRIKLFITARALALRRAERELFERGEYIPLPARGDRERHVIAFARRSGDKAVIAVASRFFTRLGDSSRPPTGGEVWGNTTIVLPGELSGCYQDRFTSRSVCAEKSEKAISLSLGEVFSHLPVALLERLSHGEHGEKGAK
jgi:(1->4)-alpha-D-glucan 1-alpha-D-glucosylmutase